MHENLVKYQTTLTIVNAIIAVGNSIGAAVAGGGGGGDSGKAFSASLDGLKALLLPGEKDKKADHARKIRKILEREAASGTFKVKPMGGGKKKKGSLTRGK